jgi:hypothetical protein
MFSSFYAGDMHAFALYIMYKANQSHCAAPSSIGDRMAHRNAFLILAAFLLAAAAGVCAEDGMCLITVATSGGQYNVNLKGNIRRIDMRNDSIVNTTGNIGYGFFARFSPDGNQFAFINGSTVTIANIDGGVVRTFGVAGEGYLSWTNGGIWICTGGKLIKYSVTGTKLLEKTGFTCCENAYVSQNELTAGGVCSNGPNGGEQPYIYSLTRGTSLQVAKRAPSNPHPGCSVCPNPSGTLLTNNLNEYPVMHHTMRILDTLGIEKYYIVLKTITGLNDSWYWNTQDWSGNSDDWIVLPIGQTNTPDNPCLNVNMEPWIYNIKTGKAKQLAHRTNDFWNPYDYYSGKCPGSTNPALQLSAAAIDFIAVAGDTNPTAKTITALTSTGSLSGLAVSGVKPWISVTPAATSGTSILITNAVSISGLSVGVYNDTITVSSTNAGSKMYAVTLTVQAKAVFTSLALTPEEATIASGGTFQFLTEPKDQAGNYFPGATVSFTATGGTITSTGKFTAGTTLGGPFYIFASAQAGSVTLKDTSIIVISTSEGFRKKINCGDNAYDAAGWERDDAYISGGVDITNTGAITTTNVPGAAPDLVYKSMRRQGPHTYTITGLKTTSYTVRFHWVEPTSAIRRYMNYSINGANVFRDFDIAARAGIVNKALVLDRVVSLQDTIMRIQCTGSNGSDVFEAGFEIMENYRNPLTLLAPTGGEKLTVGQPFIVRWSADTSEIPSIDVELSVDGKAWGFISPAEHISISQPAGAWTHWTWNVPDSFMVNNTIPTSCVSSTGYIRISNYSHPGLYSRSVSTFTIAPRGAVALRNGRTGPKGSGFAAMLTAKGMEIAAASAGNHTVEILSVDGSILAICQGTGERRYIVPSRMVSNGAYVVRMKADGRVFQKILVME